MRLMREYLQCNSKFEHRVQVGLVPSHFALRCRQGSHARVVRRPCERPQVLVARGIGTLKEGVGISHNEGNVDIA